MTRAELFAAWIILSLVVLCFAGQMSLHASYFQRKGVPADARLKSYWLARSTRGGSTVIGAIHFQAGRTTVNTTVPIGSLPDQSDVLFSRVTAAGWAPILYDPKQPTSVILALEGSPYARPPRQIFMQFAGWGLGLFALIFAPLVIMAGRTPPKRRH